MAQGAPQLYAACGSSSRSALRVLRHGVRVNEMATAPLDATPVALWTVRRTAGEVTDVYIVVAFLNATMVLSVGGETVEEVQDSGYLTSSPTLLTREMGTDLLLQVHPTGLRTIRPGGRLGQEWRPPGRRKIQQWYVQQNAPVDIF